VDEFFAPDNPAWSGDLFRGETEVRRMRSFRIVQKKKGHKMGRLKERFRQIKKLPDWIFWFPATFMKLFFKLFYRLELIDPNRLCDDPRRIIAITWHNRLMFICTSFPRRLRINSAAVISASRDGQYLADFLKFFEVAAIRGSSSRRGANAMLSAIRHIEENHTVIFTPDGPRGPKYVIKSGPVAVASKTGGRVVPFVINASRYWQLKSWDGFQIPKPFAKLTLIIGDPISVPAGLSEEELEPYRKQAEDALLAITAD